MSPLTHPQWNINRACLSTWIMPSKILNAYLSRYWGCEDWHLTAFRLIRNKFLPQKVLYPGSWIHLTPSLIFPRVVYVDLPSKSSKKLLDPELVKYIEDHLEYQEKPAIKFYYADYQSDFGDKKSSFDLLISLSSGFVSQACGQYLKSGGVLLANNEHYDASLAYTDPSFRLIGVFETPEKYQESEEIIHSYFVTTKGVPITRDMVLENSKRPPSKARYKLEKKATFYTFQKT